MFKRNDVKKTELSISANYENLRIPARALNQLLAEAAVPEEIVGQCELAMQELLTNLVEHAYEEDAAGQIAVQIQAVPGKIMIMTEDNGLAAVLDLQTMEMPDPYNLQEGGYGIAIIKGLMDEVSYRREGEKNIWILVKHFKEE